QDRAGVFDEFLGLCSRGWAHRPEGRHGAEPRALGAGGEASVERRTAPFDTKRRDGDGTSGGSTAYPPDDAPSPVTGMSGRPKCVLVIGSGPVIIGQAAEFDYAGTQACKALREEGVRVVLVNSNPATIMTDDASADAVYVEPLTVEVLERVIAAERPDGLLATLGGQTGLNLAVALDDAGVLERYGVAVIGTPMEAIRTAEDRERFKALLESIGEPAPESATVSSVR